MMLSMLVPALLALFIIIFAVLSDLGNLAIQHTPTTQTHNTHTHTHTHTVHTLTHTHTHTQHARIHRHTRTHTHTRAHLRRSTVTSPTET
jgi:ABC-type Zn2+ transport system substrate-binding protein/surface adhesin